MGGWLGLDVRHGRRSETSGNQLKMSCKTRVERNERLQRLDEWQTGRFKRNRAGRGGLRWAMCKMIRPQRRCGLSRPSRSNYASPRGLSLQLLPPPLPATASCCQHKARQAKQAGAPEKERNRRQAGWQAGRAEQSRGKSGPEVATGWAFLEQAKLKQQGKASSRDGTCHHCDLATWTRVHLVARLSAVY